VQYKFVLFSELEIKIDAVPSWMIMLKSNSIKLGLHFDVALFSSLITPGSKNTKYKCTEWHQTKLNTTAMYVHKWISSTGDKRDITYTTGSISGWQHCASGINHTVCVCSSAAVCNTATHNVISDNVINYFYSL